jgi:conjugative relaxase-like TrwC/TraI family protein
MGTPIGEMSAVLKVMNWNGSCQDELPGISEKVRDMLRVTVQTESKNAKAYYRQGEYYAVGVEMPGEWGGVAAEQLGLKGEVSKADFAALCDNVNPKTGESLTARTKQQRRVLFDLNFHVPKSVSVVYGLTGDETILKAFQNAVSETMTELEAGVKTRVRKRGLEETRITGNCVYSRFVHTTARPVSGVVDPHLHAHCTVFNATFDPVERQFKAIEMSDVYNHAPYFEAVFHARLALSLSQLGFDVSQTRTGWEISGLPQRVLDCFSRRTQEIEKRAAELGITDPKEKDRLGALTRDHKRKDLSLEELRAEWWSRLSADEQMALSQVADRQLFLPVFDPLSAEKSLTWAIEHSFERESVIPVRRLLTAALKHGIGLFPVSELLSELHKPLHGLIHRNLEGESCVTTAAVLAEEERLLRFAREGRGVCRPFGHSSSAVSDEHLNAGQQSVFRHLLNSPDRVILIRGAAGTGKTTLMTTAVSAIESTGKRVITLAPSADASRGVLRKEGFSGADTLAKFLSDPFQHAEAVDQVIWVDEAGLIGTKTMAELFRQAEFLNARVILSGDIHQHRPVERGLPLRLLETEAGLLSAELKEIRRQTGQYRDAIRQLSEGRTVDGFDMLDSLGWVLEVGDSDRDQHLADEYVANLKDKKSTLVVAPTHEEGRRVTEAIRIKLKDKRFLTDEDRLYQRLERYDSTVAERRLSAKYQVGDVVEFHQRASGFQIGLRYTVHTVSKAAVAVTDSNGLVKVLPLIHADRLTVYKPSTIPIAVGDTIRITKNGWSHDHSHRLDNGKLETVTALTSSGEIVLASGAVLDQAFGHFTHGYAVTSHASQGKTVDRVLLAVSSASFPAVGQQQFYVSTSRARERVTVYTDDATSLRQAIQKTDPRTAATEIVEPPPVAVWKAWIERRLNALKQKWPLREMLTDKAVNLDEPVKVGR